MRKNFLKCVPIMSFRICLSIVALVSLFASSANAEDSVPNKPQKLHYDLVMSEDDAVCKPLTNLYNEMLGDAVKGAKKTKADRVLTDFEMWEPERFAKIGFVQPPEQKIKMLNPTGDYEISVRLFDLFNEGKPRVLIDRQNDRGNTTSVTIEMFKQGIAPDDVAKNVGSSGINPDILDRDAGYEWLVASQKDITKKYLGYLLTKWPNFDKMYKIYSRYMQFLSDNKKLPPHSLDWALPSIDTNGGPVSEEVFIHDGHPYFILNGYHYLRGMKEESNVLVYTQTESSHNDICYINLPGKDTYIRQQAIGDK